MKRLPKPPVQSEYDAQKAIFKWADIMSEKWPVLRFLNSSANGVRVSIGLANKLKAAGLKAGYPDIFLPVSKMGFHGLFIELKRKKGGKASPAQLGWIDFLIGQGYHATICYGKSDAIWEIRQYLGIE